jgi:hypothetical protein
MEFVGALKFLGNVPCVRCSYGDELACSGIKMLHGPDATKASIGVNCWDDHAEAAREAEYLGQRIAEALAAG